MGYGRWSMVQQAPQQQQQQYQAQQQQSRMAGGFSLEVVEVRYTRWPAWVVNSGYLIG